MTICKLQMEILLFNRSDGVKGAIKVNRKESCYITQDDLHQPLLTVEEIMNVACELKIKNPVNKRSLIDDILNSLNLSAKRGNTAKQLSGGEKRRLSIALELVANPSVLFLDEPTSGLDEVTAAQCVRLLRDLTKQGRTIVCTIHQPSGAVLRLFDQVSQVNLNFILHFFLSYNHISLLDVSI